MGKSGMPAHDLPFVVCQRPRFQQNAVGNAHLADIVQQCAASYVNQFFITHIHGLRQLESHLRNALGVTFGFLIAQVQGTRPAFNCGVVGQRQIHVRALQILEQR